MLITEREKQQVEQAIRDVESQTDAELVCVLAKQSDDYYYIPALWAALLALLSPLPVAFTGWWHDTASVLLFQFAVFAAALFLLRWRPFFVRIIPRSVRYRRAANLARRQFLENNLHTTKGHTGVLIFVSELERYVEIIADRGIDRQVDNAQWQSIVDRFVQAVRDKRVAEGFMDCIASCGAILSQHVPATERKNELPNHLCIVE